MGCPSPGDLPDPGIELGSPTLQADSLPSEPPGCSALCLLKFAYYFLNFYFILRCSSFTVLCSFQVSSKVIQLYVSLFFRLLQGIEQNSLRYTVGPCWLSVLHTIVYIC